MLPVPHADLIKGVGSVDGERADSHSLLDPHLLQEEIVDRIRFIHEPEIVANECLHAITSKESEKKCTNK